MLKQLGAGALVIGAAARLTRFVTTDSLGEWWIKEPAREYAARFDPRADKYVDGLDCPHCVGFWATALVMGSGAALRWGKTWQWGAAVWAGSYVVGHLVAHADSEDDEETTVGMFGQPTSGILKFGTGFDDDEG